MKKNVGRTRRANNKLETVEIKKSEKKEEKSILLEVDEATKGIMKEIESSINNEIIEKIEEQNRKIEKLSKQFEEIFDCLEANNKILKKIERMIKEKTTSEI